MKTILIASAAVNSPLLNHTHIYSHYRRFQDWLIVSKYIIKAAAQPQRQEVRGERREANTIDESRGFLHVAYSITSATNKSPSVLNQVKDLGIKPLGQETTDTYYLLPLASCLLPFGDFVKPG